MTEDNTARIQDHNAATPQAASYLSFWGKANDGLTELRWHPAAYHMLDVGALALAWLEQTQPGIPGLSTPERYHSSLAMLIALHDIGKFSRPFQGKIEALWPAGLGPFPLGNLPNEPRHDSAGFAMLRGKLARRLVTLTNWSASDRDYLLRAICGHHGSPPKEEPKGAPCEICLEASRQFITDLEALLQPEPLPYIDEPEVTALSWWLAGLTTLADWLGSNETWFPFIVDRPPLAAYWQEAREQAARAINEAGVLPIPPHAGFGIADLLPKDAPPAPMQALVATLDLGSAAPPALIIVEDQTGSGKTEAALVLAQRIMTEKNARGLFIALPTMATANALHDRLSGQYTKLFEAGGQAPSLVLAHGKRLLNDRFAAAMRTAAAPQPVEAKDNADETASAQCEGWIAADRRRAFLADCGVGTIDQALHAVLPTRHAPLRLFGLRDRVLIIDEAHAYDAYMGEELFRLVEFQTRLGGSTVILSATLPFAKRQKFLSVFRQAVGAAGANIAHNDYPLVTVATAYAVAEIKCPPREALARSIAVERLDDAESALDAIADAANAGAAVAWIRNTVDDAIAAQTLLAGRGVAATLFHARFAMGDRLRVEGQVQDWFGKGEGRNRAHVVVGTQVMEQSLDIDVDLMVTDLAPIDLMLQRAGRLWRHQRANRPLPAPRLLIVSPEPVAAPAADWLGQMRGTKAVYHDLGLLWRGAAAIFRRPVLQVPEDVRELVEFAYGEDAEIPEALQRETERAEAERSSHAAIARMNLLKWDAGYCRGNGPWESDIRTPTRLSEPSLLIRLAIFDGGMLRPWFDGETPTKSWALSEITLPLRRVASIAEPAPRTAAALTRLRQSWPRMERDVAVLVLEPDGDAWSGRAFDRDGRESRLYYTSAVGMTMR